MTFAAIWKEKRDILVATVSTLFDDMEMPEISILSEGNKGFFGARRFSPPARMHIRLWCPYEMLYCQNKWRQQKAIRGAWIPTGGPVMNGRQ